MYIKFYEFYGHIVFDSDWIYIDIYKYSDKCIMDFGFENVKNNFSGKFLELFVFVHKIA